MLYQSTVPQIYDKNRHGRMSTSEKAIRKSIWERFESDLGESRVVFSKTIQDWMARRLSEVRVGISTFYMILTIYYVHKA